MTLCLEGLNWLSENNFNYSLATRLLWNETEDELRENFSKFITDNNLKLDAKSKTDLVTFTEMDENKDTPKLLLLAGVF